MALAVFLLAWPRASATLLPDQLDRALEAVDTVARTWPGATSAAARHGQRQELQHQCFAIIQAYQRATAGSRRRCPMWKRYGR